MTWVRGLHAYYQPTILCLKTFHQYSTILTNTNANTNTSTHHTNTNTLLFYNHILSQYPIILSFTKKSLWIKKSLVIFDNVVSVHGIEKRLLSGNKNEICPRESVREDRGFGSPVPGGSVGTSDGDPWGSPMEIKMQIQIQIQI